MREILFRGKSVDTGGWAFGNLVIQETDNSEVNFITNNETVVDVFIQPIKKAWDTHWNSFGRQEWKAVSPMPKVDPVTIGQYTGLTDKNGKKIFEGDICRNTKTNEIVSAKWHGTMACYVWSKRRADNGNLYDFGELFRAFDKYEVIGNIHDNPDMMGGTENVSHP